MFDEIRDPEPDPGQRVLRFLAGVLRSPGSRGALGAALVGVGALLVAGAWAVRAAGPSACVELRQAEFTVDELIAAKRKLEAYEREPVGELVLSGEEASFALADVLKYPVWIETRGDELFAQVALPDERGCYNIAFQGRVEIADGQARVVPSALAIGALDVSRWVAGRDFAFQPDDLRGEDARRLLSQTRALRVHSDQIAVAITHPERLR